MALRNLFNRFLLKPTIVLQSSSINNRSFSEKMAKPPARCVNFATVKLASVDDRVILVDVREPSELKEEGKIPNSVNIPLGEVGEAFKMDSSSFEKKYGPKKPGAETDFVISCRSGKRATTAYHQLRDLGYRNVSVYSGSFLDWVKNDGPVEK